MNFRKIKLIVLIIICFVPITSLHSEDKVLFYESSISVLSQNKKEYIESTQKKKFIEKSKIVEIKEIDFNEKYRIEFDDSILIYGYFEKKGSFVKFVTNNIVDYGTFIHKNKTLRGYFNVNNKLIELKPIEENMHI